MSKQTCVYKGQEYSHGATLCSGGELLKCDDGQWVNTGQSCTNNQEGAVPKDLTSLIGLSLAKFTSESGEPVRAVIVETIDEARGRRDPLSRVRGIECCDFVDAGMQNYTNISNFCPEQRMATVVWSSRYGDEKLQYRLPGNKGRLIRFRGGAGTIVSEDDWDFSYGDSARDSVTIESSSVEGGVLLTLVNYSPRYVCFKIQVRGRDLYGHAHDVIDPSGRMPIYWSLDVTLRGWINSARFEPD